MKFFFRGWWWRPHACEDVEVMTREIKPPNKPKIKRAHYLLEKRNKVLGKIACRQLPDAE